MKWLREPLARSPPAFGRRRLRVGIGVKRSWRRLVGEKLAGVHRLLFFGVRLLWAATSQSARECTGLDTIDGLQPDVGHEVLWVLRDCLVFRSVAGSQSVKCERSGADQPASRNPTGS